MYGQVLRWAEAVEDVGLSRGARVVYVALLDKAKRDPGSGEWVVRFADKALTHRTGYSRTQLRELGEQLQAAGLLTVVPGSGLQPTRYELVDVTEASRVPK